MNLETFYPRVWIKDLCVWVYTFLYDIKYKIYKTI